ncbi:MAG: SH3 domain-containing protein [Croceibacterium sp.]
MRRLLPLTAMLLAVPAAAQNREVPYWASLRAGEVNMRVGPSSDFPITWVYQRAHLPVKVVRVNQGWRLVEDPDGTRGWIVARLLKPERTALVIGKGAAEMRDGAGGGKLLWQAEPGVVGTLGDCSDGWCKLSVGDRAGWVKSERVWGAGDP